MGRVSDNILSVLCYGRGKERKPQTIYSLINETYQRYCSNVKNDLDNVGIVYKNKTEKELLELICRLTNEYVYCGKIDKKIYADILCVLNDEIKNIRDNYLLLLEMFLLCSGLYELAYKVRKVGDLKKIERYKGKWKIPYYDVLPLYWAYIQSGNQEEALKVFDRTGKLLNVYLKKEIGLLKEIVSGNIEEYKVTKLYNEDKAFENFVRGKRILIIGPAENGSDIDKYISEHDVVVSMLYRGNLDIDLAGKPHISYYSGPACVKMQEEERSYFSKLDMAVFKGIKHDFQKQLLQEERAREAFGQQTEYRPEKGEIQFARVYSNRTSCNLLQTILLELLMFHPERITVVNVNLFLARKRYNSKYKVAGTEQNTKSFRRSFAIHNMINMYQLTKLLYDNKIIEVDDECKKILEFGIEEYARRMQELESC